MLPYGYWAFFKAGFGGLYIATCVFMATTVFINYGLNLFWMHLINKQVYRLIKGTADKSDSSFLGHKASDKKE